MHTQKHANQINGGHSVRGDCGKVMYIARGDCGVRGECAEINGQEDVDQVQPFESLMSLSSDLRYDVIVGADILYDERLFDALARDIGRLDICL